MENKKPATTTEGEQTTKTCKRYGCRKKYTEAENIENCCKHHPGKPMFHDRVKGWNCCDKKAYDWDEFEKIEGCQTAKHTDVKEELKTGESMFVKSTTVQNANIALKKMPEPVKVRSIDDFNKEQAAKKIAAEKAAPVIDESLKKPFVTKNGKWRCVNKGCTKEYDNETQSEEECKHHSGNPIFHDFKKSWGCCKATAYEFDQFMKLPTCQVGVHKPKMV